MGGSKGIVTAALAALISACGLSACGTAEAVQSIAETAGPLPAALEDSLPFAEDWDAFPSVFAKGAPSYVPCFIEFSFEPWGKTCRDYAREAEERGIPGCFWSEH